MDYVGLEKNVIRVPGEIMKTGVGKEVPMVTELREALVKLLEVTDILPSFVFSSKFFNEKGIPLIRTRDLEKNSIEAFYEGP